MPDEESEGGAGETEPKSEAEAPKKAPAAKAPAAKKEGEEPARTPPPPGGIADILAEALPDVEFEAYQGITDVIVEVKADDIAKIMPVAKDDPRLDLKFLRCLFGVDLESEGFDVVYQLASLDKGHEVVIKTRLPADKPSVASVTPVWNAANWHERETRDMFGINFEGHPHLVPLLLPEDMTDHFPLRKDSPLAETAEWQGDFLVEEGAGGSSAKRST